MNSDIIETIVTAAVAAIRDQEPAIMNGTGTLRSLTVELEVASNGQVIDSICWLEWRGVHRARSTS